MGRHGATGDGQGGRGAHRAGPSGRGPFASIGYLLGSTVPKRVQPPRLLRVLTVSGLMVGLMMFGYSTTQVYLRFTEPPVDQEAVGQGDTEEEQLPPQEPTAPPSGDEDGLDSDESPTERTGAESTTAQGLTVSYNMTEWSEDSFAGQLVITNSGSAPVDGWELNLTLSEARVVAAWDSEWEATGEGARLTQPSWEDALAPGESKTVNFTAEGTPQTPGCTLNGESCGF